MRVFRPRVIEPVLGSDADDLPTLSEVEALIAAEFRKPVPDYEPEARFRLNGGRGHGTR